MKNAHVSRRTLLKGLGTVTIGLPFLEEMMVTTASGTKRRAVPVRAFNVFFGLGILQPNGLLTQRTKRGNNVGCGRYVNS